MWLCVICFLGGERISFQCHRTHFEWQSLGKAHGNAQCVYGTTGGGGGGLVCGKKQTWGWTKTRKIFSTGRDTCIYRLAVDSNSTWKKKTRKQILPDSKSSKMKTIGISNVDFPCTSQAVRLLHTQKENPKVQREKIQEQRRNTRADVSRVQKSSVNARRAGRARSAGNPSTLNKFNNEKTFLLLYYLLLYLLSVERRSTQNFDVLCEDNKSCYFILSKTISECKRVVWVQANQSQHEILLFGFQCFIVFISCAFLKKYM